MREKHPFIVLSFHTTVAAMEWEKRCMETGIPGRLIPLPREISAGCGLAWRMRPEEWEQWSGRIDTSVYDKVSVKRITLKAENTIKKLFEEEAA